MVTHLEREWARLERSPKVLATVNGWALGAAPFESLSEVLSAIGFHGAKCDSQSDQMLAKFVRHALSDPLAARIVLQRVLPPMISIASRRGKLARRGFDSAFNILLSHAWEVIRTYPIDRRPIKIAANIVRDMEYFAFVQPARRQRVHLSLDVNGDAQGVHEPSVDPCDYGAATRPSHPEEELEQLLSYAQRCRVSARSLEILRELRDYGMEGFAARNDITLRTARVWRRQAANELRVRTQCAE